MIVDMPAVSLLRAWPAVGVVTNIELFFDLVYAFAVTQLSLYLLEHATIEGAPDCPTPRDGMGTLGIDGLSRQLAGPEPSGITFIRQTRPCCRGWRGWSRRQPLRLTDHRG